MDDKDMKGKVDRSYYTGNVRKRRKRKRGKKDRG